MENPEAFGFLLGDWVIEMLVLPDGVNIGRRAVSRVSSISDGTALLDEIRHLDDSGQVNFRGASFRTYRLGAVTDNPWGREVTLIDLAGVCWHIGEPSR